MTVQALHRAIAERSAAFVLESRPQRAARRPVRSRPNREEIVFAPPHRDAAETVVGHAEAFSGIPDLEAQIMGIVRVQRIGRFHRDSPLPLAVHRAPRIQTLGVLKRAILHQLGVEAAVRAVVDVLEEDAMERWTDGMAGMGEVDGQSDRRRSREA